MVSKNENNLLFDDFAILEANLEKGLVNASPANANCDCSSNPNLNVNALLFDDVSILENALGKDALKVNSINANCDCGG